MHYYPFNLKDYLVETAHLPPMADLAYRRLLDLYYKEEAPIPNKPKWVANRIRLDSEEPVIGFVLREYFSLDGSGPTAVWRHSTCDKVIEKYQKKAAVARANGVQHVAGTKKEPISDADRSLTKNQEPRTKKKPSASDGASASRAKRQAPPDFEVTADMVLWAEHETPGVNLDLETARFRDHTFKASISDWTGAWRNWMRKAFEPVGRRSVTAPSGDPAWRTEQRSRTQQAAPGVAAGGAQAAQFFVDAEAREVAVPALTRSKA